MKYTMRAPMTFRMYRYQQKYIVLCAYHCLSELSTSANEYSQVCANQSRTLCQEAATFSDSRPLLHSWNIYKYGDNSEFLLSKTHQQPIIRNPNEVLIKVHASSVNPIDLRMRGGYGRTIINTLKQLKTFSLLESEFPLTLGRDFSGTVVDTGKLVTKFKPGNEVWGAVGLHRQGCHAIYTIVGDDEISHKPTSLTHVEAASIPYVAVTTQSALFTVGLTGPVKGKRFLVTGGTGGVGSFAIQYLKTQGAFVCVTCSTDCTSSCLDLGADEVIDYTAPDLVNQLRQQNRFDCILDTVGSLYPDLAVSILKPHCTSRYVTLTSPLLSNSDSFGLIPGLIKSSVTFGMDFLKILSSGGVYTWAFFMPDGNFLRKLANLCDDKQIKPVIESVFPFEKLPEAFNRLEQGHARGKLIIDMESHH